MQHYILTTCIGVADVLANGTIGKLLHIERNDKDENIRIWLPLPERERKVWAKARSAIRSLKIEHNVDRYAIPIFNRYLII